MNGSPIRISWFGMLALDAEELCPDTPEMQANLEREIPRFFG